MIVFVSSLLPAAAQKLSDRQVAITIDDLPAGSANTMDATTISEMTTKLLTTLRDQKVPAVGFVNEKKLYKPGDVDERIQALRMWLDYGFKLGNHTFSHSSLNVEFSQRTSKRRVDLNVVSPRVPLSPSRTSTKFSRNS